jgi:hypothetical protein
MVQFREIVKARPFYFGLTILLLGIILNQLSGYLITKLYPTLPVLNDIILDHIPYFEISFFYDLAALITLVIFVVYVIHRKKFAELPFYMSLFGLFHILRAVFIIMTPFANPAVQHNQILNGFSLFNAGVYPSGHTGWAFLTVFFAEGKYRTILLIMSIAIVVFLLLARGHYSIDIFSGIIFAYAVYMFGEQYLKKKLLVTGVNK